MNFVLHNLIGVTQSPVSGLQPDDYHGQPYGLAQQSDRQRPSIEK